MQLTNGWRNENLIGRGGWGGGGVGGWKVGTSQVETSMGVFILFLLEIFFWGGGVCACPPPSSAVSV